MVEVIDYRVSRIVILCKDCGQDVGLYPARHKCGIATSEELSQKPSNSAPNSNPNILSSDNNSESYNSYNLWNKFKTSATAITTMYNVDDDSDNESEKDDWDGETHISRILREYYENKGGDLPNWLYDSDSKEIPSNSYEIQAERASKKQILTSRNENKHSSPLEVNNDRGRQNRGRQPRPHIDYTRGSAKMDRGRDKSAPPPNSFDRNNNIRNDKYYENSYSSSLPKSIDSRRIADDTKNSNYNSLPSRHHQPPPFPTTPEHYKAKRPIPSKKSYNQLNPREHHYDNTSNKLGNGYNYNYNVQSRQGVPLSNSRVQNKNRIQDNYI